MQLRQKLNNPLVGVAGGIVLPLIAALVFYLTTSKGLSVEHYIDRCREAGNVTQIMSVAVFTNIIIFLIFNRLDMLRASKGVLGITIIWALIVFSLKLF